MKIIYSFLLLLSFSYSQNISYDPDLLDIKEGEEIYKNTCISCHGVDGQANTGMSLVVKPRDLTKSILTQKQLYEMIKEGSFTWGSRSDIMAAFKTVLDEDQLQNVTYYVFKNFVEPNHKNVKRLLDEAKFDQTISVKTGEKIFKRNCSLCHGIHGDGDSKYVKQSMASDTFIYPYNLQKILLNENQIFLYAKFGGKFWGTDKDDMPSWKNKYNDSELKSVAKYIIETINQNKLK